MILTVFDCLARAIRRNLHIIFGEKTEALYGPAWFVNNYEEEWLSDPLVQDMLVLPPDVIDRIRAILYFLLVGFSLGIHERLVSL